MSPNLIKGPLLPLAQHWQSLLRDPLRGKRDTLQKELWRLTALNALLPNRKSRIRRLINLTHSTEVIICQNLPKLQLLPLNCRKLHNSIYLLIFQWLTKPLQRHLTPIGISESPHNTNHLPLPEMHPHSCTRRHLAPSSIACPVCPSRIACPVCPSRIACPVCGGGPSCSGLSFRGGPVCSGGGIIVQKRIGKQIQDLLFKFNRQNNTNKKIA